VSTVQLPHRPGTRLIGEPVRRLEDARFVTGAAVYVGNIILPNTLQVAFVRSPVASALLGQVSTARALETPGVVDVISGRDIVGRCQPIRANTTHESWQDCEQWPLALERVRFVGEPICAVVAMTRAEAEDGADAVDLELEPLPVMTTFDAALAPDAPPLHDGWTDNCYVKHHIEGGDVDAALASAPHTLSLTSVMGRYSGVPMETRGCIAQYEEATGRLTLWSSHQTPHLIRTAIAQAIDFPEQRFRVICPDVGGGFGVKSNLYPEEIVVCLLALQLKRPIKWIEDRREHMLAAAQARDHRHEVEVGFDDEGRVLAIKARLLIDAGAYSLFPWTASLETYTAASFLPGPYRIENYRADSFAVATNKCPGGSYRGIARVPASFTMERALDQVARELGLDPLEVRRRNMVRDEDFPYLTVTGCVYDSGSYLESIDELERVARLDELKAWQEAERASGRLIGIGAACFTEQTGIGVTVSAARRAPYVFGHETVTIRIDPSGGATILTGTHSHGQGLETTLAQIAAERLGLELESVRVVFGDTLLTPWSAGTFASRSAVFAGGAVELTARILREKIVAVGAFLLNAEPDEIEIAGGRAFVANAEDHGVTIAEIAHALLLTIDRIPAYVEPGLEATATYRADPGQGAYSNGAHLAVVEVDGETGKVNVLRYVAVDDHGRMINPMIVEGQTHGGVCQALGGALFEEFRYDEMGNPLSTTFLDYLMPNATDIPDIEVSHLETLSPVTVLGIKGAGESGTLSPAPALAAAVEDAIAPLGRVFVGETPLTPERVLTLVDLARGTVVPT
jgi:carbon-monoxide dehydrogenase large subunit